MNIIHQHPHFRKLRKQGLTYVDMHYHSDFSMDSSTRINFIAKTAKLLGCGVAVTDHNAIQGAVELHNKGVMVVPSIEITPSELIDIIPFFYSLNDLKDFYSKYIKNYLKPNIGFNFNRVTWKFEEMIDKLKKYSCLITMPHIAAHYPQNAESFVKGMSKRLLNKIDGFEILNGLMNKERNERTIEIVKNFKKCFVGGSDGHTLLQLGRVVTVAENSDVEGFLDKIKKRENVIMGEELPWLYRRAVQLIIIKNAFLLKVKENIPVEEAMEKIKEQAKIPIKKAGQTVNIVREQSRKQFKKIKEKSREQIKKSKSQLKKIKRRFP